MPRLNKALRKGVEDAFRWLHACWNNRIYRYCFVLARGDDAVANELVQATYLRIMRHIRPLPDEEALWAWIARAARSAAADRHRMNTRYSKALHRFHIRTGSKQETTLPQDEEALFSLLDKTLDELEDGERFLIEQRYFKQVPLERIGSTLNCSARAVEGRLARLRKKIQQHLQQRLQQETEK